ncbi:MAG TPA: hypothetical protein GX702_12185 [Chloroflexi bacterium]|jgi:hypothetical protein|nr:hypothetical protein [Chloroflexota bacterium]
MTGSVRRRVTLQEIGTLIPEQPAPDGPSTDGGMTVNNEIPIAIIHPGTANNLHFSAALLSRSAERFADVPCFVDHAGPADRGRPGGRSVRDLVGIVHNPMWDREAGQVRARLRLAECAGWMQKLIAEFGPHPALFGLSADMWLFVNGKEVTGIEIVNSVDIVVRPAAGGRFLSSEAAGQSQEKMTMPDEMTRRHTQQAVETDTERSTETLSPPPDNDAVPVAAPPSDDVARLSAQVAEMRLAAASLPEHLKDFCRAQLRSGALPPAALDGLLDRLTRAWAETQAQASIQGLGHVGEARSGLERITLAFERLMGLPESAGHRSVARLSGIREMYDLLTGDYERHGVFRAERVQLANVTTTTMAHVVANVLNKVVLSAYTSRVPWWKGIAWEDDFPNMQPVRWITLGGVGDLDAVDEGAAYTEKSWQDHAETSDFIKRGNYLGITMEMIDRDDVAAVRALPRRLGIAAQRTLSAAVAGLFTTGNGAGPALADGISLFDAEEHLNLGNAPLSVEAWDGAIVSMFSQTELNSGKRMGLRPRFCLVPIELEKEALTIFTSDGLPGTPNNDANVRRHSGQVVVVPEWTDPRNWAAVADPADLEGICIGYRFGRAPEIFVAQEETGGSMFTHDEMRIKVRFIYTVGVGDYRALYKSNVVAG